MQNRRSPETPMPGRRPGAEMGDEDKDQNVINPGGEPKVTRPVVPDRRKRPEKR